MFIDEVASRIREGQHFFNDQVVTHMQAMQHEHGMVAILTLMLIGFVYGAVHAVGPGHGKVIVSSYLLASEDSLRRGLVIVALSSLLQAVVAITIVLAFYFVLNLSRAKTEYVFSILESCSYALIAAVGLWFVVRGVRGFSAVLAKTHSHAEHHHNNCCGHAHAPAPDKVILRAGFMPFITMIVSIGARPCSGALLLLFFACRFDLVWAGILATLAMALGTALATGALAVITVKSKNLALFFINKSDRSLKLMHAGLRLFGGMVIVLVATAFLLAQYSADMPAQSEKRPLFKALQ